MFSIDYLINLKIFIYWLKLRKHLMISKLISALEVSAKFDVLAQNHGEETYNARKLI